MVNIRFFLYYPFIYLEEVSNKLPKLRSTRSVLQYNIKHVRFRY